MYVHDGISSRLASIDDPLVVGALALFPGIAGPMIMWRCDAS